MAQRNATAETAVQNRRAETEQNGAVPRRKLTIFRAFLHWSVLGIAMGLFAGTIGSGFHLALKIATNLRANLPWLLYLLPVAGLLLVGIYHFFGLKRDRGTNLCIVGVRDGTPIPLGQAVCIIFGTVLTHLCGGSSGREGAALQIGGSVASFIGKKFKLDAEEERLMVLCGMSACFSALFGTPTAAAIFVLELISVGRIYYSALLPCILSSVTAHLVAQTFGIEVLSFSFVMPEASAPQLALVVLLSVLCAGLSHFFCSTLRYTQKAYKKFLRNPFLRVFVGGLLVVGVTLLIGSQKYSGTGVDVIVRSFQIHSKWWEFLLKLLLTALTLGAGYKGGEIIPAFFVGATFGSAVAELLTLSPAVGAAIGMIAVFCGVTNCPFASLVIGIEMFGADGIAFYGIAVAVSYLISGYTGLYGEQRILYSKVRPHFIDRRIADRRPSKFSQKFFPDEETDTAAEK